MAKAKLGRPTVMTPEVLRALQVIFLIGATQEEACRYSGISVKTLWSYTEKHPEFLQEIRAWQEDGILKARRKVIEEIPEDINTAKWYLERKRKSEFSLRQELTGKDGDAIQPILVKFLDENDTKDNATDNTHTTGV